MEDSKKKIKRHILVAIKNVRDIYIKYIRQNETLKNTYNQK